MSESAVDTNASPESAASTGPAEAEAVDLAAARAEDRRRMKHLGRLHFVAAMVALTLWGAADAWAASSGWLLAQAVAIANAFIAATALAGIVHEWGHLAGARLSGATSPMNEKPIRYFFVFDFSFDANDARQFLWMSWGGILAPWLLVVGVLVLVPIDSISRLALLSVLAAKAAAASLFEVPIALRTARGGDPRTELGRELKDGGLASSERWSWAVGAVVFAAIWLVI